MPNLNRYLITKKIIDAFVDFLKQNIATNKLYNNTKVSDRFAYDTALIPCVIIRQTSNTQRRIHFDDFMEDHVNRVQLLPISGNNIIVGNNTQRVNLPISIDWNPTWAWDTSIPLPSGSDITQVLLTSGTAPYNTTDRPTGIIIEVPPPSVFIPTSIERAQEILAIDQYTREPVPSTITSGNFNVAIGLTGNQFYLVYSGTGLSGTQILPVNPDDYVVNPPGLPQNMSIKMNDVLFAGDQYLLNTYTKPTFISERFGGLYDITLNFDIYAMSTIECQELCDAIERFLVEKKFELWNKYGFTATAWSKSGESEEAHLNEYIFKASLSTQGMVEWHEDRGVTLITSVIASGVPIGGYTTANIPVYNEPHIQTGPSFLPSGSTAITPSGILYYTTSGTYADCINIPLNTFGTAESILSVYNTSGSFLSVQDNAYTNASGSGWYLQGNSINWSAGSYEDFNVVAVSGWIPASGTQFYVNYLLGNYIPVGVITNAGLSPDGPGFAFSSNYNQIVIVPSGI